MSSIEAKTPVRPENNQYGENGAGDLLVNEPGMVEGENGNDDNEEEGDEEKDKETNKDDDHAEVEAQAPKGHAAGRPDCP